MLDFTSILLRMISLFLVILVGYAANKCHVMEGDFNRQLSNLVLSVTTPCLILSSVLGGDESYTPGQIGSALVIATLGYVLSLVLAFVVTWCMHTPKNQAGIMRFMLIFGNVGFIGLPVINMIFGAEAVFYAAIFNMPFNIFVYSVGVYLVAGKQEGPAGGFSWKDLCSPCMIAAALSLVLALTGVQIPAVAGEAVSLVGQITTPAALLIIGSNLATMPLKGILGGPRIWIMSAVRLLANPALFFLMLRPWVTDPTILGVAIVIQGMPVATVCTMMALKYDGDTVSAGQGTLVSTLLSIVTIPLLTLLL